MAKQSIDIDLKWGCWYDSKDMWEDYAPEGWDKIVSLNIGECIDVHTAPRKECYTGSVTIGREADGWWASGYFCSMWDEPYELADTLDVVQIAYGKWKKYFDHIEDYNDRDVLVPAMIKYLVEVDHWTEEDAAAIAAKSEPQDEDCFRESLPFSWHTMEPGVDNDFEVKAATLQELMALIDEEENKTWVASREEWNLLCDCYGKPHLKERD